MVAVLSARGKETDRLIADAFEVSPRPDPREMDMLLSTGERVSCALCAMAINDLGHRAISLTGSQAGIVTDTSHTKARILDVRADRIFRALDEDAIVLVAGFQGVSTAKDVTTLGRGGSDTTAVALAAAVGAEVCEIYTDVAGRLQRRPADRPERAQAARRLLRGDARDGRVGRRRAPAAQRRVRPQPRRAHPLPVELRRGAGYCCRLRRGHDGTAADHRRHPLARRGPRHAHGRAGHARRRRPRDDGARRANVNIDMIVQGEPETEGLRADMSFTIPRDDVHTARTALDPIASELGMTLATDETMGKVSIVGAGMKTHPGVAAKVFTTLGDNGINIEMISTSPIRISCVVPGDRVPDAVKALHTAFELSGEGTIRPEQPFGEFAA